MTLPDPNAAARPEGKDRQTIVIRGRATVAARPSPSRSRRRRLDRAGHRPDRVAMWAVVLGMFLAAVAAASGHA